MNKQNNRQPSALYFLFTVELWERFGFYTMRSFVVLYLTQVFLFSDAKSYTLFGTFSALIWLTPSFGGYVADRLFGYRRSLIIGGILLTLGYALLALPQKQWFYLGMSTLLIGNGFFKANAASLVGMLYDGPTDARRDGGFTIYYMGINLGGMLGPFVAGLVSVRYGWAAGFATASVGMLVGLLIFIFGQGMLGQRGKLQHPEVMKKKLLPGLSYGTLVYISIVLLIIAGYYLLYNVTLADFVLEGIGALIVIAYILASLRQSKAERNKMLGCLVLIIFSIAFWVLYQQAPMTVNLFTQRNVDRSIFGIMIPTATFQSFNPIFIIIFTPLLNWFWKFMGRSRFIMPTSLKFTLGIILMALGFLILKWAAIFFNHEGIVSGWWVVLSYALQSLGELALSPIGLSMMTAMAPRNMSGMMIGIWFLASAASNAIAGSVAKLAALPTGKIATVDAAQIYGHAFGIFGWAAIIVGFISLMFVPVLRRMMGEIKTATK